MSRWTNPDDGPDDQEVVALLDSYAIQEAKAGRYDQASLMSDASRRLAAALDRAETNEMAAAYAYDDAQRSVYALLAEGFDVMDGTGESEAPIFRVRYVHEAGDPSVGMADSSWFEVVTETVKDTSSSTTSAEELARYDR